VERDTLLVSKEGAMKNWDDVDVIIGLAALMIIGGFATMMFLACS
jgi:hypothetical protein